MASGGFQRFPSIVFTFDEDDNENSMEVNFSTPIGSENRSHPILTSPSTITPTNAARAIIPPSTPMRPTPRRQTAAAIRTKKEIEIIDLVTPQKQPIIIVQQNYIQRTIHYYNQQRLSILPAFPTTTTDTTEHLLLANVSQGQLSLQELERRQTGKYNCKFHIMDPDASATSLMVENYQVYFGSIVQPFKIDMSILDHNYMRLKHFLQLFRTARLRILPASKCSERDLHISKGEFPELFEFYLQMDVDLFYMKTCSFRDAQPRSKIEGIFCLDVPQCHYALIPCHNCKLCLTPTNNTSYQQPSVVFNRYEKHHFINGYESILNCPATCMTKNVISVLTCLCGQAEFICETKYCLADRLDGYRTISNYLISKFLIGEKNFQAMKFKETSVKITREKERMLVHQHFMHCSATIQQFLDKNQHYWRFVPLANDDANRENTAYRRASATTTAMSPNVQQNKDIKQFLDNIPDPPIGYKFTKRQIEKQVEFFKNNFQNESINEYTNLFTTAMIAVLPPDTTDLFRYIVHSLFVTHTEAKLNTLGHVLKRTMHTDARHGVWCENLRRRPTSYGH